MRLRLEHITKQYGTLRANDDISATFEGGRIHALLGENGAGKTTLMSILYGLVAPDEGRILLNDAELALRSPADAIASGIGMVHQHFMLIDRLTVAENIALGFEPRRRIAALPTRLDREAARQTVESLSTKFGMRVDPDALVGDLPVGLRQRVEILKSLARDARILILDEPTGVLAPGEVESFFSVLRSLKEHGRTVLFITHKLNEVKQVADTVTVLRRGTVAGVLAPDAPTEDLVAMMIGSATNLSLGWTEGTAGEPVLTADALVLSNPGGSERSRTPISLDVREGEIVGVAGVEGNGQVDLLECLVGLRSPRSGRVLLGRIDVTQLPTRNRYDAGLGYVPEDRARDGFIPGLSIEKSLVVRRTRTPTFFRRGLLRREAIRANAEQSIREFDIRTTGPAQPTDRLSGGNQQKVMLAAEMSRDLQCLVVAQPTRGIDVGSANFIHRRLMKLRDEQVGVLVVSAELDELLAVSDRIVVMRNGGLAGEFPRPFDRNAIARAMVSGVEAKVTLEHVEATA